VQIRFEHLPADIAGLSEFSRAALAAGPEFGPLPVLRRIEDLERPEDRHVAPERQALAGAIRKGLEGHQPPGRVLASLNALAEEETFCVITGQQPGLFTSPLYSLYKALQACRLAHELADRWGTPVVPVFWNHADDHDIAEVHHAHQLNANLDLQKIGLSGIGSGRRPISRIELTDEGQRLPAMREALAQMYGDHPYTEEALELFFPRDGETLAAAFTRAFTKLLGEHGLVVVEPDWIRQDLSRALAQVVATDPLPALLRGTEELAAAGHEVAIDPAQAVLVYRVDEDGRRAQRAGGEGFQYDGEPGSRTAAELAAEIVQEPEKWSPGALLRPLVQDAVFPTAAYVGGYGELAYHAELGPLRDLAGLPRVAFAPRISLTLVDPETRHALDRIGADVRTIIESRGALAAASEDSPAVIAALRESAERAAEELLAHRTELAAIDEALGTNLKRTARQIRELVGKLLKKAERVQANKSGKGARVLRRVQGTLAPHGNLQERVLGPLQYVARYGTDWIHFLYNELPALASEHLVAQLDPEASGEETP